MGNPTVVNVRTGSPALIRMNNGLTQNFIDTIPGVIEDAVAAADDFAHNRYMEIGDKEFVLSDGTIYERTAPATFVSRVTGVRDLNFFASGFHTFMDPTNGPGLALLDNGGAISSFRMHRYYYNTDTWDLVLFPGVGGSSQKCSYSMVYDNVVYAWSFFSDILYTLDPRGAGSLVATNGPGNGTGVFAQCSLVGYNGIIYAVTWPNQNVDAELYTLLAGVFVSQGALAGTQHVGGASPSSDEGVEAIYELDGKIYVILPEDPAGDGSRMFEFDPGGPTITEVTNSVLHPDLRPGGGLADSNLHRTRRFYVWQDNESPFGARDANIQVFIGAQTEGSALYRHQAGGSMVIVGSSQWNGAQCGVIQPHGGGEISTVDTPLRPVPTTEPFSEDIGIVFEIDAHGDPGSPDKYVRLWYSTERGTPITRATMIAPTSGGTGGISMIANNQLELVDADDGVTTYRFKHNASADGLTPGQTVHYMIELSPNANP